MEPSNPMGTITRNTFFKIEQSRNVAIINRDGGNIGYMEAYEPAMSFHHNTITICNHSKYEVISYIKSLFTKLPITYRLCSH